MSLPPGPVYLAKQLPRILAPPVAIYCTKLVAELCFQDLVVPTWLTTIACVFSGPALLTVIVQYRDYQIRRQAAALGAVLPPTVPNSFGGLNMLFTNTDARYPGKWTESSVDNPSKTRKTTLRRRLSDSRRKHWLYVQSPVPLSSSR